MKKQPCKHICMILVLAMCLSLLAGCANGRSPDKAASVSSAGDFSNWFGQDSKNGLSGKSQSGTYYFTLKRDISVSEAGIIGGGHTVVLDLNGHSISGDSSQVFSVTDGGKLTLKNGTVTSAGVAVDGGVVQVSGADCALHLQDVTMSTTNDNAENKASGGVIFATSPVEAPAIVTVRGKSVITGSDSGTRRLGGAVALMGGAQLYLANGTIQNGSAGTGGNIYLDENAKLFMSGGAVTGGKATSGSAAAGDGGNISICGQAQVHMYGGTVSNGEARKTGGNIFLSCSGIEHKAGFYQYGGIVENGIATTSGGNVSAAEKASYVCIYGGEIRMGQAPKGGNVFLASAAMEMRGGTLTGHNANAGIKNGGNIYALQSELALYDGIIKDGWTSGSGGNIFGESSVLNMFGGSIIDGKTESVGVETGGGNLYMSGTSQLNLYDGEISGGIGNCLYQEKTASGPNVMVANHTNIQMFGGTIKNGYIQGTVLRTGCLYINGRGKGDYCVFHMYGGTMENGPLDYTESVRGMTLGCYSAADNSGIAITRLFGGEHIYTGPANDPDRHYTLWGNRHELNLFIFEKGQYEGLYAGGSVGPCRDNSHNTEVEVIPAGCVTPGCTKYHCDTCGDWYQITAPAAGHTETINTVAATETLAGYTEHSCSVCGESRYSEIISPVE